MSFNNMILVLGLSPFLFILRQLTHRGFQAEVAAPHEVADLRSRSYTHSLHCRLNAMRAIRTDCSILDSLYDLDNSRGGFMYSILHKFMFKQNASRCYFENAIKGQVPRKYICILYPGRRMGVASGPICNVPRPTDF
ncbi:hypothetical protein BJ166DRAFT_219312 [Pestalotiopsis sp. NC0098]|nr:hypothetical protein BJ166DRAFT_219312 [Pestalotiopsis sp. NC0098]